MTIPTARVKVEFLKILKIPAASLPAGVIRYARANFRAAFRAQSSTGRSRPIPHSGGDFDVTTEKSPWIFEADMNTGESINISVDIWEDHGDDDSFLSSASATLVMDPWTSGVSTFDRFEVRVTTTLINPVDKAFLARAAKQSGISGSLTVPQGFFVEFVDIKGLYKPAGKVVPPSPGASHVPGYSSEDHEGRIFTNRIPDGSWKSGTQFIDVFVKVTSFGGPTIPAGAKIDWTVVDVDDATNDDSEFHRRWGPYVDANDYDASGKPLGAHPDDNALAFSAGNSDENLLFGALTPTGRWEQAPGGPAPAASSGTRATTNLTPAGPKTATSAVRLHCPNVLGTNFVLKAGVIGTPAGIPVFSAQTGVMTMWCRLDVEVTRMAGAFSLSTALPGIPEFFVKACVQLDFQAERPVTDPALDRPELAAADRLLEDASAHWAANPSVFTHVGQPGWFFLGAARLPYPLLVAETGNTTAGSKKVTGLSSPGTPGINLNSSVSGDGIPQGARVASLDDPASVTLSVAATKTNSGVNLQFGPPIIIETGDTTAGSKKITGLSAPGTSHLVKHMPVTGGGIPDDTVIDSIDGPTSVTLSAAATVTSTATTLVFERVRLLYQGTSFNLSTYHTSVFVDVPHIIADPEIAWFTWDHGHGRQNAIFYIGSSSTFGGSTLMLLSGNDITPAFTGHDANGSEKHAYASEILFSPGYQCAKAATSLSPGGFAIPADAILLVKRAGAGFTGGISPDIPNPADGTDSFFAGRTIVFTHASDFVTGSPPAPKPDFKELVVGTVVHELVHAFGMPHKCGNWDWRTPRRQSCCMNYNISWLVDEDTLDFPWPDLAKKLKMKPATINKQGNHMCARHLMEVRRVHLEKNLGLNWQ